MAVALGDLVGLGFVGVLLVDSGGDVVGGGDEGVRFPWSWVFLLDLIILLGAIWIGGL